MSPRSMHAAPPAPASPSPSPSRVAACAAWTARALALLAAALVAAACTSEPEPPQPMQRPTPPQRDALVASLYPSLAQIYQGAQGIYRGCGPNGNVCHNSRQYPNMNTLGALALNINQPCNQLQDDPTRIDDWCERQGDTVVVGTERRLLAYIQRVSERTETNGSRWAIVTQGDLPTLTSQTNLRIVRVRAGRSDLQLVAVPATRLTADPARANAVFVQLDVDDDRTDTAFTRAGIPAELDAIQFGDPNRNGVFGVGLGHRLIYAGHPERSYLIRRLIDPSAGPLMPLANCCFWTHESLRALWCWIANLNEDGSNAFDYIDYSRCPEGPVQNIEYPQPGPLCENGGLCPVRARDPVPDEPTWPNLYANVFVPRCGGSNCHRNRDPAGNLDLGTADVAYEQLLRSNPPRVIPGNPAMSSLYDRLTATCTPGSLARCRRMPASQPPLPANEISLVQRWILAGARQDGTVGDGGIPDVVATDAADARDGGGDDVVATDASDIVTVDMGTPDVAGDAGAGDAGGSDASESDGGMDAAAE